MSTFDLVGQFLLFLVPGFVVYTEYRYLTAKKDSVELQDVAFLFLASIVSFLGGDLLVIAVNLLPGADLQPVDVIGLLCGSTESLTTAGFAFAIAAAAVIGIAAVAVQEKGPLFRLLNRLGISRKADNKDVWDSLFEKETWIVLRDHVTGNTYFGQVDRYSDNGEQRELLLEDVHVWEADVDETGDDGYHMEKVYISRGPSEFVIEIDDYRKGRNSYDEVRYKIKRKAERRGGYRGHRDDPALL